MQMENKFQSIKCTQQKGSLSHLRFLELLSRSNHCYQIYVYLKHFIL